MDSPTGYRRLSSRPGQAPLSGSELPLYTRRDTLSQPYAVREPTEHVFHLMDGKCKPWASLKVLSSAKSSHLLPTFFERENVGGSVEFNLEKGDSIQAVTVSVTGRIITGAGASDAYTFLDLAVPLWSKASGDSRTPSPQQGQSTSNKLQGSCSFPFSIALPKAVGVPAHPGAAPQIFKLPETFLERHTRASIQYDLTLRISRGKLRADSQLKTAFGYIPMTRPDPPSLLRQLAYQECCSLPGPDADAEGWKTLQPATVRGSIFSNRQTEVKCTFSLAKPLCYTRGTVIPCSLTLESRDTQVLDVLSASSSIVVVLKRRVRYYGAATASSTLDNGWKDSFDDISSAVWWLAEGRNEDLQTRHLEGEIRLPKEMKPTSAVGHFSVSYAVVLCPFDAAGFVSEESEPILAESVEIATKHAKGPRCRPYAPPGYDPVSRRNKKEFFATSRGFTWNA